MKETLQGLIIPGGLVHAHIHLDKCFLLDKTPVQDGSFEEALRQTGEVKRSFTRSDLLERGSRLIRTSVQHGVLAMRAFVEVDPTVELLCLKAGLELRSLFRSICDIQLVVFAQDPLLYPDDPSKQINMAKFMEEACSLTTPQDIVGSTPYVEREYDQQCQNIQMVFDLAEKHDRHVDFHLDYNLDEKQVPLIWYLLQEAQKRKWKRHITIGHATRLSLFDNSDWNRLAEMSSGLLLSFVALPNSDLYMQGRSTPYKSRGRATLPLMELHKRGLPCALAVNNIANLFTPQGDADPLALLPMMVAIWQSATPEDLKVLLSMVTTSASKAIMMVNSHFPEPQTGQISLTEDGQAELNMDIGTQSYTVLPGCSGVQEAVFSPSAARLAIKDGKLVAWTKVDRGVRSSPS